MDNIPEGIELKILNTISRNCEKDAIIIDNMYIIVNINKLTEDIYKLFNQKNINDE